MISPTTSIVASSKNSALQLNRKQFPVVPAEALTVHKSQGGTYDSVVVYDTSRKKMSRSSIYVAASRATKAAGLKLICKENKFIPPPPLSADKGSDLYLEICRHEGVRLIPQFAHLSTRTNIEFNIQLISHNVKGLGPNFRQITCDQVYLSSDVILLSETWTNTTDSFEITGFEVLSSADRSNANEKIGARCYISHRLLQKFSFSQIVCTDRVFRQGIHTVGIAVVSLDRNIYCSIYVSPQPTQEILLESLQYVFGLPFDRIVIGGDFNVDFLLPSSKRDLILQLMNDKGLRSCLPESTHSTTRANTFIVICDNQNFTLSLSH